jgi:hypothetical protein
MVFLVAVSVIVASMSSWVGNDLNNTTHFTSAHSLETAANDAIEAAVQSVRYSSSNTPAIEQEISQAMLNASPPVPCWTTSPTPSQFSSSGLPTMDVWCSTLWAPYSASTRTVTFSTCLDTLPASPTTAQSVAAATACHLNPELQAVVVFDDYPYPLGEPSSSACASPDCGYGMTVQSWIFNPVVPTVTGISPTTGSTSGGTTVTITGTGFASGASVNFVDAKSGTNWVLPASSVTVVSSTSITVKSPATPSSSTDTAYNVTVTTPEGTSAVSSHSAFTY